MMRISADTAREDGAAGKIVEHATRDFDRAGTEPDAGRMCFGIVADAERDLAQVGKQQPMNRST